MEIRLPWETIRNEQPFDDNHPAHPAPSAAALCLLDSPHPQIALSPSLVSIDRNSDSSSSHTTLTSEPGSKKISKASPWIAGSPPELELSFLYNSPSLLSGIPYAEDSPSSEPLPAILSTADIAAPLASSLDANSGTSEPKTIVTSGKQKSFSLYIFSIWEIVWETDSPRHSISLFEFTAADGMFAASHTASDGSHAAPAAVIGSVR
jgi:hypothetical protein